MYKPFLRAFTVVLFCWMLKGVEQADAQQLSGHVFLLRGNQMPSPGRPVSKGRGISRDVFIYESTTVAQTTGQAPLFVSVKTKLIAKTTSDSTGYYTVKLPPGNYSVFIGEKGGLFAAESDGTGRLNPVTLLMGNLTKKDFTISLNATF